MADEFQYVRMPDGSYGKFRADAPPDVIRSAIQKDFPDHFRSAASPIPPPALRRPDPMHQHYNIGPEDKTPVPLQDELMNMGKSLLKSMYGVTGPGAIHHVIQSNVGSPANRAAGRQSLEDSILPALMLAIPGAEEGAGEASGMAGRAARSSTNLSEAIPSRSSAVRPPASAPFLGRTTTPTTGGVASDLLELVAPKASARLKAGGRLLGRIKGRAEEANPPDSPEPIKFRPGEATSTAPIVRRNPSTYAAPMEQAPKSTQEILTRSKITKPRPPRPEPAWKRLQKTEGGKSEKGGEGEKSEKSGKSGEGDAVKRTDNPFDDTVGASSTIEQDPTMPRPPQRRATDALKRERGTGSPADRAPANAPTNAPVTATSTAKNTPAVRKFKMGQTGDINPHPRRYYPEQEITDEEVKRALAGRKGDGSRRLRKR